MILMYEDVCHAFLEIIIYISSSSSYLQAFWDTRIHPSISNFLCMSYLYCSAHPHPALK